MDKQEEEIKRIDDGGDAWNDDDEVVKLKYRPIKRGKHTEVQLAKQIDEECGNAIGDLYRRLADPEYRYLYIKAEIKTAGEFAAAKASKAIKEKLSNCKPKEKP